MRSHLAPDHPVSFSLVVLATREDAWDRVAIVRGFWDCPGSAWSEWTERTVTRRVASTFASSGRGPRRYPCGGCGRRSSRVRSARDRQWDDLPWAAHPVTVIYRQRRIQCRHCGVRTERIEFADPKVRVPRRLRQQIGVDCQSMPTSHAVRRVPSLSDRAQTRATSPRGATPLRRGHDACANGRAVWGPCDALVGARRLATRKRDSSGSDRDQRRGARTCTRSPAKRLVSVRSFRKPITSPCTTSDKTVQNCWPLPR
jgi:hypothetical protein